MKLYDTQHMAVLFGSQDGKKFYPVGGIKVKDSWFTQIEILCKGSSFKFFQLAYAGRIENNEIRGVDFNFDGRNDNKLR